MKKKILITRKLLKSNEERAAKLWDAKLNSNDEIYPQEKLIKLSKDCDGILCSIEDKLDKIIINKLSNNCLLYTSPSPRD